MENLLLDWGHNAIDNAPVLVFLGLVAYDLRRHLLNCIAHNQQVLDDLLERFLNEK